MNKTYKVEILEDPLLVIDKIWSKDVLIKSWKMISSLSAFHNIGRKYITPHGNICYAIIIDPFIYFYQVDHKKQIVTVIAAYHGKQNYWNKFRPLQ